MLRASPRSPLPLLAGGIAVGLLVIILATLPVTNRQDGSKQEALNEREALTLVAHDMRTGDAALRVASEGKGRWEDGSWFVTVGDASFHFSERNRIVVADNDAARTLQLRDR